MSIAAVILAGGEGRRMGGAKPFRTLGGERLIDRALRTASQWSSILAIAVRDPQLFDGITASLILDDPEAEGPIAGVIAGAVFAASQGAERLLTIPADTPFLPSDLAVRLGEALQDPVGAAVASSGGLLHPVCALWNVDALEACQGHLRTGRHSLHGLARHLGFVSVEWPVDFADPFFNVNDAEDLAQAEAILAQKSRMSTGSPAS